MGKIGSIIREKRQSRGWSLDRAADDTNISVRFLSKIENDDFTGFPGEPYVVGFIRNYAEYLGLDGEALIALYRDKTEPAAQTAVQEVAAAVPATAVPATATPAAAAVPVTAVPSAEAPASKPSGKGRKSTKPQAAAPEPASMNPEEIKALYTTAIPAAAAPAAGPSAHAVSVPHEAYLPGVVEETSPVPAAGKSRQKRSSTNAATEQNSGKKHPAGTDTGPTTSPSPSPASKTVSPSEKVENPAAIAPKTRINPLMAAGVGLVLVFLAIMGLVTFNKKRAEAVRNEAASQATEYSVEGSPFEQRLHVGDSLLVPLRENVYRIGLSSIGETVRLESPFGPYELSLGGTASIDPDQDGFPDVIILLGDFEKEKAKAGALLRVEFPITTAGGAQSDEVTIPAGALPTQAEGSLTAGDSAAIAAAQTAARAAAESVILKSSRGPYPFVAQISFRGSCLFRYESDRKEWVEKYYAKGESLTVNVSNSLTLWASNAQAVKLGIQVSGGKTADLEIGGPGEITVKRISWSRAEGTWALVATELD